MAPTVQSREPVAVPAMVPLRLVLPPLLQVPVLEAGVELLEEPLQARKAKQPRAARAVAERRMRNMDASFQGCP